VGAGLLANAVDQPINRLTGTPHSRASPLPHQVNVYACLQLKPVTALPQRGGERVKALTQQLIVT